MKEALAAVLAGLQGLGSDDSRERPVDRLGALGAIQNHNAEATAANAFLSALGVRLVSFKFANRPDSRAEAEALLSKALSWGLWKMKLTGRERDKIAAWAVMEYCVDFCPVCSGRKEVPDREGLDGAQRMKACQPCLGSGRRRYTDQERIEAMGAAYERAMGIAHGIMGRAEDLCVRGAKDMLERW